MPRFFFNVRDHYGVVPDKEGCDLHGLSDALDEAKNSARDLAKQYIDSQKCFDQSCIDISDEGGVVVAALYVREIVDHPVFPKFSSYRVSAANLARTEGALVDAHTEYLANKLTFENERRSLDAREAAEDRRWLVEETELIAAIKFSQEH